jgi:hypothetical protein
MPVDRNEGILQWLDGGSERYLIQCDEDSVPPLNVLDLTRTNQHLVGTTYLCTSDRGFMIAAKGINEPCLDCKGEECEACEGNGLIVPRVFPKEDPKEPDLMEVDWIGTGCYLISRKLAEDLITREGHVFRFHMDERGRKKEGVDVDMCRRARKLGYTVYLHRGLITGHVKSSTWAPSKSGQLLQIPWGCYWEGADVPANAAERKPINDIIKVKRENI